MNTSTVGVIIPEDEILKVRGTDGIDRGFRVRLVWSSPAPGLLKCECWQSYGRLMFAIAARQPAEKLRERVIRELRKGGLSAGT